MYLPDVVGFQMGDAVNLLEKTGIILEKVSVTAPPREKSDIFDESYRVIRVIVVEDNKVELLLCKPL